VEKAEELEEQEDPDVVEVPVFGVAASDLGKCKEQEQPEQEKGKEVIDLTSDSEDELSDGKMTLPKVLNHEVDLPKGKKARAQFDSDVDALVRHITLVLKVDIAF
jgi:hypothetical protein